MKDTQAMIWGKGEWNMHDFCQKQIASSSARDVACVMEI